jgi:hypothetical protein
MAVASAVAALATVRLWPRRLQFMRGVWRLHFNVLFGKHAMREHVALEILS